MGTMQEFIDGYQIEMTTTKLARRTDSDQWGAGASHWQLVLTRVGQGKASELVCNYSMGTSHKGRPKLVNVLDCLALDASSVDNARDFQDWADDCGRDGDSRKAERIYLACAEQARQLRGLLGTDGYAKLLYDTERE